jgi:hypothetical protein
VWLRRAYKLALVAGVGMSLGSCTPSIGDKCVLSTDCSSRADRQCDTSQPDGYCTVFNCTGDGCPDKAACVLFNKSVPGCGYDDRAGGGGSRVARSSCVARCMSNSDCRGDYVCADPKRAPWNALILDDDQGQLTCLVKPVGWDDDAGALATPVTDAPVCKPTGPDVPTIDAGPAPGLDAGSVGIVDASDGGG